MKLGKCNLWIIALVTLFLAGTTPVVEARVKKGKAKSAVTKNGKKGKKASAGKNLTFTVKGVTFEMVPVDGGSFTTTNRVGYDQYDEKHVTLKSYYIGQTEVTQALWQAVMEDNPSEVKNDNGPVENMRYEDCIFFIYKLNELTGKAFRFPTAAEWQFAARGGNLSKGYLYSGGNDINQVAWYEGNSDGKPHPVATKAPNELGIYDMSGNVSEWCAEYDDGTRSTSADIGPGLARPSATFYNGSWKSSPEECEIKYMDQNEGRSYPFIGLRLAL